MFTSTNLGGLDFCFNFYGGSCPANKFQGVSQGFAAFCRHFEGPPPYGCFWHLLIRIILDGQFYMEEDTTFLAQLASQIARIEELWILNSIWPTLIKCFWGACWGIYFAILFLILSKGTLCDHPEEKNQLFLKNWPIIFCQEFFKKFYHFQSF